MNDIFNIPILICKRQFLVSGWSQTNYVSLGTSIEAPRPKNCNTSSRRACINTSNHRPVISTKKTIEIASFNMLQYDKPGFALMELGMSHGKFTGKCLKL